MATQGILSIIRNNEVVRKIVTGSDGMKLIQVADELKLNPTIDARVLRDLCHKHRVGSMGSLIIQTSPNNYLGSEGKVQPTLPELNPLYKEKFFDALFNPRWDYGTASYSFCVDITDPANVVIHDKNKSRQ